MTPQDKKYLKIAGAIVAAGVILYYVTKSKTDTSGGNYDPTGNGGPTAPPGVFNAAQVANKLYEAMRKTGTDESAVLLALKNVTESQFAQVITAFKNRSYNSTLGNQINFNPFTDLPLRNLQYWLKNELTESEYNKMRLKYPNYL